ncbi:MAG: hypothetical protein ACR2NX_07625 [Chthoniobacterales bacterium]
MGWNGLKNGELLARMQQERIDVFLTGDRNLQFQQHLPETGIAVVLLSGKSTRLADTMPLMAEVLAHLPDLQSGTLTVIPATATGTT